MTILAKFLCDSYEGDIEDDPKEEEEIITNLHYSDLYLIFQQVDCWNLIILFVIYLKYYYNVIQGSTLAKSGGKKSKIPVNNRKADHSKLIFTQAEKVSCYAN